MILLTDCLFPSKYAKWRIEEIKSFIDEKDTDILVFKLDQWGDILHGFDYDEMKDYYGLDKFNILIFDPKYNFVNKYNKRINGKVFNRKFPGSYLFTKRTDFDVKRYRAIYHIFLSLWRFFNENYKFLNKNQFIHLYPGGGYASKDSLLKVNKETNIISTQHFITEALVKNKFPSFVEVLGATFLQKDSGYTKRQINNGTLKICFSNLVGKETKGVYAYVQIAEQYTKQYPEDDVKFYSVGNCQSSESISHYQPISMNNLEKLYDKMDILISPDTKEDLSGWPLGGIEAMLHGVVVVTTDIKHSNKHFRFTKDMMVITEEGIPNTIQNIKKLYLNRKLLNSMSVNVQKYANDLFSYKNQQQVIFDFIDRKTK